MQGDGEQAIERELQALRRVAAAARVVVGLAHADNPELDDLTTTEADAVRELIRALEALPGPPDPRVGARR